MKKRCSQSPRSTDASDEPKYKVVKFADTEACTTHPVRQDLVDVLIQNGTSSDDLQQYWTCTGTPAWFYKKYRSPCGTKIYEVDIITHRKKKYVEALEQYHEEKARTAYVRSVLVDYLLDSTNLKPNFILENIVVGYVGNDVRLEPVISLEDSDWPSGSDGAASPWSEDEVGWV